MSLETLIAENTAALKELTLAVRASAGNTSKSSTTTSGAKTTPPADDKGPFHWHNPTTKEFGTAKTKAAFDKLVKADEDVTRITADELKALEEGGDDEGDDDGADVPSVDDLKKAFGAFLQIDDEKKRNARKGFVTKMVESVGVERASEIPEQYRAAALAILEEALAGKKPDPASLKDRGAAEEEEEEEGDLV